MHLVTVHNRQNGDQYSTPGMNRKEIGTVVLEAPEAELVIKTFADQIQALDVRLVPVKIGAAFLYYKDQLNKKEGRKLAISRMKEIECTIEVHDYQNMIDALYLVLRGVDDILRWNTYLRLRFIVKSVSCELWAS